MTTIAYRDGILAADGLATRGSIIVERNAAKVVRAANGDVIAFTGELNLLDRFVKWYDDQSLEPVNLEAKDGDTSTAIVLSKSGLTEFQALGRSTINDIYCSWGSGSAAAMAALHMGASAEEAVRVAAEVDIYTGGTVIALALEG